MRTRSRWSKILVLIDIDLIEENEKKWARVNKTHITKENELFHNIEE
jgi:hypothetical protein